MASTNCWRCLARPSHRILAPGSIAPSTTSASATFSTSAQLSAKSSGSQFRAGKRMVLGKKKRQPDRFKPPAPGERKAFRKRIQLSNDNALEVSGLEILNLQNIVDPKTVGNIVRLSDTVIDQLRASEAFKPTQNWALFRSPHMLIRNETVNLAKKITDTVANKQTLRMVITGEKGSGKSILGLQALATGFMNNCVVINIPEGQDLTTARTEYSPVPNSDQFSQPTYTVKLMQTIQKTNPILSQCRVELDHMHLPVTLTRGMPLSSVLTASKEPEFAWPVFQAFWKELMLPGRPPLMFVIDGVNHIMRVSEYRSPAYELIHSHDLGLIRLFVDGLGGKTSFANGAVFLGVHNQSNAPSLPSMDKALAQAAAIQNGTEVPQRDPFYRKYDERIFEALKGVNVFDVKGVSKSEARAIMEYWAASGILRTRVDERSVSEKWTMAGGGVLAEMERVALYDLRVSM
ncbi:mitochondrial ribosomal death-associated protein 3-domain-containing protein [Xylariomycetidae sp. FL2044]|nr:mitochondrial ribosomal death-associated protein 3-domain-containing protein [Xylariomycetidae sp. FL2044]